MIRRRNLFAGSAGSAFKKAITFPARAGAAPARGIIGGMHKSLKTALKYGTPKRGRTEKEYSRTSIKKPRI